jgi:cellulose synthase/poly-beta-1,6-N-acetylglucosamine synthase-like glycosyltransferase
LTAFQILLLALYVPMTLLLACYGIHRVHMLVEYLIVRKKNPSPEGELAELPTILVQIPVFNEREVVTRILTAVDAIDYPREKLRVQVLDDSTDDTVEISRRECDRLRAKGLDIALIHRTDRSGFKAGALANGLEQDDSELVAIFDADFEPRPGVLMAMVPYFANEKVGMVQTRWEHLNLERNLLTRLQSFLIDGHFILEHTYRHRTGRFFNFNGTAGMWRRSCIDDAGGWSSSSITEDTEISFRAYVRGWKFVYLRDFTSPAELPSDIDAYKSQQHRWAKGYTEVLLEHFWTIWRAPITLLAKFEATLMLSNHFAFLLMGALTILHFPLLYIRTGFHATGAQTLLDLLGLTLVVFAFFAFYLISQWEAKRLTWKRALLVPVVLGMGIAQMVNSSRAVLEALFGHKTGFVRTPKEGDKKKKSYKANAGLGQAVTEVAFGIYLLVSSIWLAGQGHVFATPLNLLVAFGFLYLGLGTLRARWAVEEGPKSLPANDLQAPAAAAPPSDESPAAGIEPSA